MALIVLIAAALRFETIGAHLSNDEGYSYLVGSAPSAGAFLHRLAAYENTPPLFYLLLTPLPLGHTAWLRVPALIPGVLMSLVMYGALRRPLGARIALLAAAIVAVAPYAVSYSDYSRGFMLENFGCLLALWAMLVLVEGGSPRWWLLYAAGGVVALYSEYFAAIFVIALAVSVAAFGQRDRVRVAALGVLPLASLLPWIPEIVRGQDALHHTKSLPAYPGASWRSLRDVSVRLALGEHGAASSPAIRTLEFLALVLVLVAALVTLRKLCPGEGRNPARRAVLVIGTTGVLVLVGHAVVPAFGPNIFDERYLTVLIPLVAALIATAVATAPGRRLWPVAIAVVAVGGLAVFAKRYGREYEPDLAPVRAVVAAAHPRTVLTNSAVAAYYLRRLDPILDRPFGLGRGLERSCAAPCVVVDDTRIAGGLRPGAGPVREIGPFRIRIARG